jgi:hypothetical protein
MRCLVIGGASFLGSQDRFSGFAEENPKQQRAEIERAPQQLAWELTIDLYAGLCLSLEHF